jgi:ribosomal protein L1
MAKLTKRQKATAGKVDTTKLYPLENALALVKECATAKFDESIDVRCSSASMPRSPTRSFAARS